MSRWSARNVGEKPPNLRIEYKSLAGNPTADKLAKLMGILSDAEVHFTPEFLSRLDFQPRAQGTQIYSEYLETKDSEIANHIGLLAAIHVVIIKALDQCADGGFSANPAFLTALEGTGARVRLLKEMYPFRLPPEAEN